MRKIYLYVVIVSLLLSGFPVGVFGSSGLTVGHVGGKGLNPEVIPGETYGQTLTVNIGSEGSATGAIIEVLGYGSTLESDTIPLLPQDDKSSYSARTFIQPGYISLDCEPGVTKETKITISIPYNTKPGGYYAILRFSTIPKAGNGSIGIIQSIVLPMKFTVTGGILLYTGKIGDITVGEAQSGKPVEIFTSFENTGNHHYYVTDQVEVKDSSGTIVDNMYVNALSPVPEGFKRIKANLIPKQPLAIGQYFVKSRLTLQDGTVLDEANGQFEVKAPYVPPPAPASLDLKPSSASNLKTADGRISVEFPQGAVLSEAQLSLRSYPLEQLPPMRTGYTSGTTGFRVDGLNGLLAKNAALNVKYATSDLEKAGGDASRFVLARWDEAASQWVLLKTSIDSSTQILRAETNQFGIIAILVGPPHSTRLNWMIIGPIVLLIVVTWLYLIFFRPKKSKK